jgi:hypothetical protein
VGSDFETVLGYDASQFSGKTVGSQSSNRRNGLDKVLLKKIKNIIRNETGLGRESINTCDIYSKLLAAGVEVPDQAMPEILAQMEKERLITTIAFEDRDGEEKHGACRINWVSRDL